MRLPAGAVMELIEAYPALAMAVIRRLGERVLHYIGMVEDLSLRSVEARLANTLLQHAEWREGQLMVPRRDWTTFDEMAVRLGTVRDVLSRGLKTLEAEGLLKVEKQAILVLGRQRLYRWLTVAMFRVGKTRDRDEALLEVALTRARFLETVADSSLGKKDCDELFLVGLLSLFDVLLAIPVHRCPEVVVEAVFARHAPREEGRVRGKRERDVGVRLFEEDGVGSEGREGRRLDSLVAVEREVVRAQRVDADHDDRGGRKRLGRARGRARALAARRRKGGYGVKEKVASGQWHTLRVEFGGNKFKLYFNGRKLFDVVDDTFADAGKVGLWTKADSVTIFDDFAYGTK